MTRAYNRKALERKEEELLATILHKVAKRMEVRADKVGYPIDEDSDWMQVHTLLIQWEFDGLRLIGDTRIALLDMMECIGVRIGYNFWAGFVYYTERTDIRLQGGGGCSPQCEYPFPYRTRRIRVRKNGGFPKCRTLAGEGGERYLWCPRLADTLVC